MKKLLIFYHVSGIHSVSFAYFCGYPKEASRLCCFKGSVDAPGAQKGGGSAMKLRPVLHRCCQGFC